MTPYEKFKGIPNAEHYLKCGLTLKKLDDIAVAMTDNQAADHLQHQRKELFKQIHGDCKKTA